MASPGPSAAPSSIRIREVGLSQPLLWLAAGWKDFLRALPPSLLHGLLFAVGGAAILAIAWGRFFLLAGAFSGFLIVAPILSTGLYELSRRLERNEPAGLVQVVGAWTSGVRCLIKMGVLLAAVGTLWVIASTLLIALFADESLGQLEAFLRKVVFAPDSSLFLFWTLAGGVMAALVFAATVVSVPLLLDRDIQLAAAVNASFDAVSSNPIAMGIWATIIMVLTFFAMATMLLGLIVILPVIGHATWHAYRDVVDASNLPERH